MTQKVCRDGGYLFDGQRVELHPDSTVHGTRLGVEVKAAKSTAEAAEVPEMQWKFQPKELLDTACAVAREGQGRGL